MSEISGDRVRDRQQQIIADLRALILSVDIGPGERLPATAALIEQYGVTNQTVQRALRILKEEGFIRGETGVGVFSTDRRQVLATSPSLITALASDLRSGNFPRFPSARFRPRHLQLRAGSTVGRPAAAGHLPGSRTRQATSQQPRQEGRRP